MSPGRRDALLAALLVVACEAELHGRHPISVVAALSLAVVARRRGVPLTALLAVPAVGVVDAVCGGVVVADLVTPLLALVVLAAGAGARSRPGRLVAALAAGVVLLTVADQVATNRFAPLNDVFFYALLLGAPAVAARFLGARSRQVAALRRTTEELARQGDVVEEVARAEEAERLERAVDVALADRLRQIVAGIARADREAHDQPRSVPPALAGVEATARAALQELRDELGLLRSTADPGAGAPAVAPPAIAPPDRRSARVRPVDLAMALAAVPLAVETAGSLRAPLALDLLACAAQGLALAFARRAPRRAVVVLVLVAAAQSAFVASLPPAVTWTLPPMLLGFAAGAWLPRWPALQGLALLAAGSALVTVATPASDRAVSGLLPGAVVVLALWCCGRAWWALRRRGAELDALADRLQRSRLARARLAVAQQRAELARELHDVGAHTLTVVCLQAGAAQRTWVLDPVAARQALSTVVELAEASLTHLQQSLAGLGADDGGHALDTVAELGRALGLAVDVRVTGAVRVLPGAAAHVAHRLVQEALTNAARHAGRARVLVSVHYGELLSIEVRSDREEGTGPPVADVPGAGVGLRGMRERVERLGGRLAYGPETEGCFVVSADLPLEVAVPA